MAEESFPVEALSQITTCWDLLRQAHTGLPEEAARAQDLLARRYQRAVTRYLRRLGCSADLADELTQRFFVDLLRGRLRRADRRRGSFRSLLKVVLRHLLAKERRAAARRPLPVAPDQLARAGAADEPEDGDTAFDEVWRDELLARTWEALAQANPRYYRVLRLRAEQPRLPSQQMAEQLAREYEEPVSAEAVRKTLERARARFAWCLAEEVSQSLDAPTPETVAAELADLRLLKYCPGLVPKPGLAKPPAGGGAGRGDS
jgi:RNA polymerase sigma factor (sigma-70 family)